MLEETILPDVELAFQLASKIACLAESLLSDDHDLMRAVPSQIAIDAVQHLRVQIERLPPTFLLPFYGCGSPYVRCSFGSLSANNYHSICINELWPNVLKLHSLVNRARLTDEELRHFFLATEEARERTAYRDMLSDEVTYLESSNFRRLRCDLRAECESQRQSLKRKIRKLKSSSASLIKGVQNAACNLLKALDELHIAFGEKRDGKDVDAKAVFTCCRKTEALINVLCVYCTPIVPFNFPLTTVLAMVPVLHQGEISGAAVENYFLSEASAQGVLPDWEQRGTLKSMELLRWGTQQAIQACELQLQIKQDGDAIRGDEVAALPTIPVESSTPGISAATVVAPVHVSSQQAPTQECASEQKAIAFTSEDSQCDAVKEADLMPTVLPEMLSAGQLAKMIEQPVPRVESFLRRFRERKVDSYVEVSEPRRNEPKYLYRTNQVWPALQKQLKVWTGGPKP